MTKIIEFIKSIFSFIIKILPMIKHYIYNVLIGIDQLVNALLLGDPDETISSRVGRVCPDSWVAYHINYLFFWQSNHVIQAIEKSEGSQDILFPRIKEVK